MLNDNNDNNKNNSLNNDINSSIDDTKIIEISEEDYKENNEEVNTMSYNDDENNSQEYNSDSENLYENDDSLDNENDYTQAEETIYPDIAEPKNTKKKKGKRKRGLGANIMALILVAVISATAGGVTSAVVTSKYLAKNNNINSNKSNTNTQISSSNTPTSTLGTLSIPDIAKKVGPAVVGVSTKSFPKNLGYGFVIEGQPGLGSGIIFDEKGYILTNYHVVEGAQTINVIFNNGKEASAKVINSDPNYDVAVIKITDESVKMPGVAEFGDSDSLQVGETAVAIGNPLGTDLLGSVTSGIISAVDRTIDERNADLKMIQTNAAINAGNSGGPLINSKGQVIGINTEKKVGTGVEGLGFAIPINQIKPKIQTLMTPKVETPALMFGITSRNITEEDSKNYNLPVGVYVVEVAQYSPAELAGIKPGDVITEVNGKKIKTNDELNKTKEGHKSGDVLTVKVNRDNKNVTLKVTLKEIKTTSK